MVKSDQLEMADDLDVEALLEAPYKRGVGWTICNILFVHICVKLMFACKCFVCR